MDEDFGHKMLRLEADVNALAASGPVDADLVAGINGLLSVMDSYAEHCELSREMLAALNRQKMRYAELLGSRMLYHSADRSARIDRITQDVERIAGAQQIVHDYVAGQASAVDTILAHMAVSELYIQDSLSEMAVHKQSVGRRMKYWRAAAVFGTVLAGLAIYRIVLG
ncbi:hypothetical protein PAPHI01_0517 [Pancytospora philotis]|nr:hypothetical protein PAPHI01_0517 [Pancytospora philotis]